MKLLIGLGLIGFAVVAVFICWVSTGLTLYRWDDPYSGFGLTVRIFGGVLGLVAVVASALLYFRSGRKTFARLLCTIAAGLGAVALLWEFAPLMLLLAAAVSILAGLVEMASGRDSSGAGDGGWLDFGGDDGD
ncbi:MAG: hypothetical protein AAGB29_03280 [Planctomycetota bacterium]